MARQAKMTASPMILTLQRQPSEKDGTFGQLFLDGQQLCVTVELPWLADKPRISCIPPGVYRLVPHNSAAHPHTWEVADVPGRSEILIHNANLASQLLGCIGVGDTYGSFNGVKGVCNSVKTLNMLRSRLIDPLTLVIA